MRRLVPLLVAGLLAFTGVAAPSPIASAAAAASGPKIVLIVGATHAATDSYRADMDAVYATAIQYSSNVVKVYSPNATWAAAKAALQGANIVVYMGHGNGFPSPYTTTLMPDRQDGLGLNAVAGQSDSNTTYYGESDLQGSVRLAPNAVVILAHLCYASGNSEPGMPAPTLAVAEERIDNFAAGFLAAGARAVIADAHADTSWYLDQLFTTRGPALPFEAVEPRQHVHVREHSHAGAHRLRGPGWLRSVHRLLPFDGRAADAADGRRHGRRARGCRGRHAA